MNRLDIQKIIAYIGAIPAVSSLVSNKIYWGLPKDEPTTDYLVLQEVSENQDEVDASSRVEFRFIAKSDTTNWDKLYQIERAITDAISNKWWIDFGWFKCYKVTLESNVFTGYDEKDRKTYIRDYIFYFSN